jgi:hypothetical protein
MTKRELIEALEALDCSDNTLVVTAGFDEGGITEIAIVEVVQIMFESDKGSPYAEHSLVEDYHTADYLKDFNIVPAVYIDFAGGL